MSDRQSATRSRDQQEASSGYFAPLEWAKCMLLNTFERDGTPVSNFWLMTPQATTASARKASEVLISELTG